jgi:hypothetical protein
MVYCGRNVDGLHIVENADFSPKYFTAFSLLILPREEIKLVET